MGKLSLDMRSGAQGSRGLQTAGRWLTAVPAALRVRSEAWARWSAGREPTPQAHKEGRLPRLWPRSQSIPFCALHSTFLFSSWLLVERLVSAFVATGERLQLVKKLGVVLHGLQIIHYGGLSGGGGGLVPIGDAQIGSSTHQKHDG